MRADRRARACLPLLAAVLVAADAGAFCRTTTVPESQEKTGSSCLDSGHPLYWKQACIGYHLSEGASKQVSLEDATTLAAEAFAAWMSPGYVCTPSINVIPLAATATTEAVYHPNGPNENIIVFRDEGWTEENGYPFQALELTTLTYLTLTGEVLDADIEINSGLAKLAFARPGDADAGEADPSAYDLRLIMTHSAGHFLGLAHSEVSDSVMFPVAGPGLRPLPLLTSDDAQGICSVYPATRERTSTDDEGHEVRIPASVCSLSTSDPAAGSSCPPMVVHHGCAMTTAALSEQVAWPAACLAAALIQRRRRRGKTKGWSVE
jgi:Matrixin